MLVTRTGLPSAKFCLSSQLPNTRGSPRQSPSWTHTKPASKRASACGAEGRAGRVLWPFRTLYGPWCPTECVHFFLCCL